jgi:hypothetical protein
MWDKLGSTSPDFEADLRACDLDPRNTAILPPILLVQSNAVTSWNAA